jgi:hypothetical protein
LCCDFQSQQNCLGGLAYDCESRGTAGEPGGRDSPPELPADLLEATGRLDRLCTPNQMIRCSGHPNRPKLRRPEARAAELPDLAYDGGAELLAGGFAVC